MLIRHKVILGVIVTVALLAGMLALIGSVTTHRAEEDLIAAVHQNRSVLWSNALLEQTDSMKAGMKEIEEDFNIRKALKENDGAALQDSARTAYELMKDTGRFDGIQIFDVNGKAVFSAPDEQPGLSDAALIERAVRTGQPLSSLATDAHGRPVNVLAAPLQMGREHEIVGAALFVSRLDAPLNLLNQFDQSESRVLSGGESQPPSLPADLEVDMPEAGEKAFVVAKRGDRVYSVGMQPIRNLDHLAVGHLVSVKDQTDYYRARALFSLSAYVGTAVITLFALYLLYRYQKKALAPLMVGVARARQIARGDFSSGIASYGRDDEIGQMLDALNGIQSTLQSLITEISGQTEAAIAGELKRRADPSQHQGDYRKITQGLNDTLDAVIGPLAMAADYVQRIGRGDIPPKITASYPGEFNTLKHNLNQAIDNVNALIADTLLLSRSAVEGKLSTRVDASKHQGDYAKIVQGVNETLDAVTSPISLAARYIESIARGDMPEKITGGFRGDFDTLKDSLNLAIDNIKLLVVETDDLVRAATAGDLAVRADTSRLHGEYRKIVQGINDTLDAIVVPIDDVVRVLAALARNDLGQKIAAGHRGTFARLSDDVNTSVNNLANSVGHIKEATDAIGAAAREIAAGNADLSQRTEKQALSLQKTAETMDRMAATVRQNADRAAQANAMAMAASNVAGQGGQMVRSVVATMGEINESAGRIADIIGVIDGIAFQTNILALNAAVEAARAGEQGRGFAVVAGEVRSLAQRSAAAAREIKSLIGDSVGKVQNGAQLVEETGQTMEKIVASVSGVTDFMAEIAAATAEQSRGIEDVNRTVTGMDEVTQHNAALVEEAAAAAKSLEAQVAMLSDTMGRFRLGADDGETGGLVLPHDLLQRPSRGLRAFRANGFALLDAPATDLRQSSAVDHSR
ncbi:methyl-accepting chemotaxis protein [Methylococcus sp. EFPC2]|uniref:methyl-accepting chemotaxis protein n=1 Tax=Methylococcus sp. EFPC2 TaxID=2812648 RepID=UPI0019687184|nr:methyl-accepting chemotaxis protein [Methylococcus sp. EFPC2]QSA97871.1 HAMP domain-containing protein [Methylococcus sp. EFPC2]